MLSEAQDVGETPLHWQEKQAKKIKSILKSITLRLKLAKEHPLVQQEFKKRLIENPYVYSQRYNF